MFEIIKCLKCEFSSKQEATLNKHYINIHAIEPENLYIEIYCNNTKPACLCGCGEAVRWQGWKKGFLKYIRFHNDSGFHSSKSFKKAAIARTEGYRTGKYKVWNSGLSKDTDERIIRMSQKAAETTLNQYKNGERISWQEKEPEKSKISSQKSSETKRQLFATGQIKIWNKGLTKETSEKVRDVGNKISTATSENSVRRLKPEAVKDIVENAGFICDFELNDYKNKYQRLKIRCKNCNEISIKALHSIKSSPICFKCNPKDSISQIEIYNFIQSLNFHDAIISDRIAISPQELDVFVPSKNFAIEFNGLYWHSAIYKTPSFHENKTILCNQQNIKLFHIFEDEWIDKKNIVKSMIRHRLGIQTRKIPARKCKIYELSQKDKADFFETTHLDGDATSLISWGLSYNDEIVAAISLRKAIYKQNCFELARFSCALDTNVVGGLGRLLSIAKKWLQVNGITNLMTYVDKRHGNGNGYEKVGFRYVDDTAQPRFWWTLGELGKVRANRMKYKADKKVNMTEKQVAAAAGVYKIYGCKNKIYEMTI